MTAEQFQVALEECSVLAGMNSDFVARVLNDARKAYLCPTNAFKGPAGNLESLPSVDYLESMRTFFESFYPADDQESVAGVPPTFRDFDDEKNGAS